MNKKLVDTKIFKILSYVYVLWVVGLLSPYRNEKDVKFHVGQGMIVTTITVIMYLLVLLINKFVIFNVFVDRINISAFESVKLVNNTGNIIALVLKLSVFAFMFIFDAMGLIKVLKGKDKYLPLIGKLSFINKIY